jgi:hypothetical protein
VGPAPHALELARTHGFKEQADDILAELQSLRAEDLDLKPITAEIPIPTEATDRFIEGLAKLVSARWRLRLGSSLSSSRKANVQGEYAHSVRSSRLQWAHR